ncbi:MAG: hypothetical protein ACK5MU_02690 [Candidatus Saccharimonadales bacterium]
MENKGGKNEVIPAAPEQAEQSYFGAVEQFPPNIEMPQVEAMGAPEQQGAAQMPPDLPDAAPELTVVKNTMPLVERNAEQMPKQYVKIVEDTAKELKARPFELQNRVIELKKDYIRQAFDRELGKTA